MGLRIRWADTASSPKINFLSFWPGGESDVKRRFGRLPIAPHVKDNQNRTSFRLQRPQGHDVNRILSNSLLSPNALPLKKRNSARLDAFRLDDQLDQPDVPIGRSRGKALVQERLSCLEQIAAEKAKDNSPSPAPSACFFLFCAVAGTMRISAKSTHACCTF